MNHKRASIIETVYHSLNEPMLKEHNRFGYMYINRFFATFSSSILSLLCACIFTGIMLTQVDPCAKPHQPSNVNKLVINGIVDYSYTHKCNNITVQQVIQHPLLVREKEPVAQLKPMVLAYMHAEL